MDNEIRNYEEVSTTCSGGKKGVIALVGLGLAGLAAGIVVKAKKSRNKDDEDEDEE